MLTLVLTLVPSQGLLFNYQEALDLPCLVAAAARLVELLSARTTGMVLRERAELGDLLQGWGELTRRRLGRASASQTCRWTTEAGARACARIAESRFYTFRIACLLST